MLVPEVQLVEHLADLLARHGGIVDEEDVVLDRVLHRRHLGDRRLAEGRGHDLLDVEDRHQAAGLARARIGRQLGDGRDEALRRRHQAFGRAHLVPVDADDAVDAIDQEAQGALVVFGHHHGAAQRLRHAGQVEHPAQRDHRDDVAAQRDQALDAGRHVRRAGDHRRARHLAHLEDVDAEDLAGAQREQQDLHAVGARQPGAGIDAFQQIVVHALHELASGFRRPPGRAPGRAAG